MMADIEQQTFQPGEQNGSVAQTFEVRLAGPLDIPASLEMFRRNGDDLLDRWDGSTFVRTLPVGTRSVAYACTLGGTREEPTLLVALEDARWKTQVERALKTTFVEAPAAFTTLLQTDPVIAQLEKNYRGLRPVLQFD